MKRILGLIMIVYSLKMLYTLRDEHIQNNDNIYTQISDWGTCLLLLLTGFLLLVLN